MTIVHSIPLYINFERGSSRFYPFTIMPLPSVREAKLDSDPSALSAYNICYALEGSATTEDDRMHTRILGYLILHAPSFIARAQIVDVIHSYSQGEDTLLELGRYFLLYFVCPCKLCISFVGRERGSSLTSFSQKVQRLDPDFIRQFEPFIK